MTKTPPPPARALRKLVQKLGMHPDDPEATSFNLAGKRGLVVATNVAWLDIAKPTGVFASEMTVPYYAFLDAGMDVDLASPAGGMIAGRSQVAPARGPHARGRPVYGRR